MSEASLTETMKFRPACSICGSDIIGRWDQAGEESEFPVTPIIHYDSRVGIYCTNGHVQGDVVAFGRYLTR